MGLIATLSIYNTQSKWYWAIQFHDSEYGYAGFYWNNECRYPECKLLGVLMMNAIVLSVVAPSERLDFYETWKNAFYIIIEGAIEKV